MLPFHYFRPSICPGEVEGGDEGSRRHGGVPVHYGLLHVPLYGLQHHGVRNGAQRSDGGSSVAVLLPCHVLGQRGSHDDHILRYVGQLLDPEVHEPPQDGVASLEQLRDGKKTFRSFRCSERFSLARKKFNICLCDKIFRNFT